MVILIADLKSSLSQMPLVMFTVCGNHRGGCHGEGHLERPSKETQTDCWWPQGTIRRHSVRPGLALLAASLMPCVSQPRAFAHTLPFVECFSFSVLVVKSYLTSEAQLKPVSSAKSYLTNEFYRDPPPLNF